jgi:hypothetical protein
MHLLLNIHATGWKSHDSAPQNWKLAEDGISRAGL